MTGEKCRHCGGAIEYMDTWWVNGEAIHDPWWIHVLYNAREIDLDHYDHDATPVPEATL